jgi:6-phosphogluconolactonase (cycloisomerase 2 family)
MLRSLVVRSLVFATFASSVLAFSQVPSSPTDSKEQAPSGSPVAFVYVSSTQGGNAYEVTGYSVVSTGQLTVISGSPFAANVQNMALNGKFLFGTNGVDIDSFSIASNGALTQVSTLNAQAFNQDGCGGPEALFVDRTGTSLYDADYLGSSCANNAYQSFSINSTTGAIDYLGSAIASPAFNSPLAFVANDTYGYSSSCYRSTATIYGYQRNDDQILTQASINPAIPSAPAGEYYCPYLAASDSANHVAIPLTPLSDNTWAPAGPVQIAVYTSGTSGNLITTSTAANMPKTAITSATDVRISPSGKYLAIAGTTGVQVFHFNGASPLTKLSGLLTTDQIDHVFWDNVGHLYAISTSAGKLFVFTVTATTATQAPGSPHTITSPQNLAVLVK